jgi:hypothetical protein
MDIERLEQLERFGKAPLFFGALLPIGMQGSADFPASRLGHDGLAVTRHRAKLGAKLVDQLPQFSVFLCLSVSDGTSSKPRHVAPLPLRPAISHPNPSVSISSLTLSP